MTKDIAEVLSQSKENMESAYDIWTGYMAAQNKIVTDRFLWKIEKFVKDKYGQDIELKTREDKSDRHIIEFSLNIPDWKHIRIRFDNEKVKEIDDCLGIYGFGFKEKETNAKEENKKISTFVATNIEHEMQTPWWPLINGLYDYPFWERDTIMSLFDQADEIV